MKTSFSKLAVVGLVVVTMALSSLSDPLGEATWTLDETPTKIATVVDPKPIIDVPEPLRKLFPLLNEIEREVSFGQERGDATALLKAVKDLTQAEYFTGLQGASSSSDRLLEEATELAWEQRDPEALRESLVLWSSPNRSGRSRDKILETSDRLEQVEEERAEMLMKKRCSIIFHNRTEGPVKVFVNRKPIGTLSAGERHVVGELLAGRQYLGANDSSLQWGPRKVYVGPGEVFNWRLFD
jgi:hypothetical protein